MRHGTTGRRQRGKGNGQRRGNSQRMQVFDSNGPDVRIRGTAHQVAEKYINLAKDAASSGDVILSESYLQHAEHYQRVINSWEAEFCAEEAQGRSFSEESARPAKKTGRSNSKEDLSLPSNLLRGDVKEKLESSPGERTVEALSS